ncbi:hypothetical protein FSP39_003250 [Pinctada imbricata]|uniref:Xylose isomerase n=1 Tax=Pinctada imbricata TaxID=66713 RepID=A0AA88XPQ3_PINIB|nr:hypothetical protein FSP39_003250 [Pinctada imbricata]
MSSFAPTASGGSGPDAKQYAKYDDPNAEFFPGVGTIPYKADSGPADTMVFKHYDPKKVVKGKTMEEWLRFSVCFWHTFRGTAPEGSTLEETNKNLDEITDLALELQKKTGVKLLWATCNLFAHPRYMNGAASNPDVAILAMAGAQVKKGLEIALKLGAENFVFWGGREGYHTILNTNVLTELTNMASFFKMAAAYKKKIGFTGTLLIEPKPKEPTKHQYDYGRSRQLNISMIMLNIEPNHTTLAGHGYEHDVVMASAFGMLGSVDSNTGSPDLGWDTDQFPMDIKNTTLVMKTILEQGGLQPGGLNFDCKVRRESTALNDMFISHIGAMDSFARGLMNAAKVLEEGVITGHVKKRYSSYETGLGKKGGQQRSYTGGTGGKEYTKKNGVPNDGPSGQQEHYEAMLNYYV